MKGVFKFLLAIATAAMATFLYRLIVGVFVISVIFVGSTVVAHAADIADVDEPEESWSDTIGRFCNSPVGIIVCWTIGGGVGNCAYDWYVEGDPCWEKRRLRLSGEEIRETRAYYDWATTSRRLFE